MTTVFNVTDVDEFFKKIREGEDFEHLHPAQRVLTWGSDFVFFYGSVPVFGHILTEAEVVQTETESGADPDEVAELLRWVTECQARHRLYYRGVSRLETEGEYGFIGAEHVWPITAEEHAEAVDKQFQTNRFSIPLQFSLATARRALMNGGTP